MTSSIIRCSIFGDVLVHDAWTEEESGKFDDLGVLERRFCTEKPQTQAQNNNKQREPCARCTNALQKESHKILHL